MAASGISQWTPRGCCSMWSSPPPACRTATPPARCCGICAAPARVSGWPGPTPGYQAHRLTAWATALRITLQIVRRPDDLHTFTVLPRRWVVERTFAWISKHRRTARDYEHLPASHEAMILWAMIALMTRRLAPPTDLSDAH